MTICNSCRPPAYDPTLYPSYDVLNPGQDVRINPLGFTSVDPATGVVTIKWDQVAAIINKDGLIVINEAFWKWVRELKDEVLKLREDLRKKK